MAANIIPSLVMALLAGGSLADAATMASPGYRMEFGAATGGGSYDMASPGYASQGAILADLAPPAGGSDSPSYSAQPGPLAGAASAGPANGVLDPANTTGIPAVGDALIVMKAVVGEVSLTPEQLVHADVAPLKNGKPAPDGKVDLGDVLLILRRVVKLVSW